MKPVLGLLLVGLLAACASNVPRAIREAPANDIRPAQALAEPGALRGTPVRWGGVVASVQNRQDETWIEIVERPLYSDGEPRRTDASGGRFLARIAGFIDPSVYATKRLVTVTGTLEEPVTRTIGEYPYRYPVVRATALYLWPKDPEYGYYYPYYSPYWYDPWYPWGYPYPYRHLH